MAKINFPEEIVNGVEFRVILSIEGQNNHTQSFTTRKDAKKAIKEMERDLIATNTGFIIRLICNVYEDGELVTNSEVGRSEFYPETEEEPTTEKATEEEETHAARCLHIYVNNTSEIYTDYIQPAISKTAARMRSNATHKQQFDVTPSGVAEMMEVRHAVSRAAGLVRRFDKLAPTDADKKRVRLNLAEFIIEQAEYQTKTA